MTGSPGRIVLAAPDRPRASVIIPAWRRAELLRRCLASLARLSDTTPFETVVILNGASDDVATLVRDEVDGATVVTSRVNLGFGGGCNRAARAASGDLFVLLNDDTEVDAGWLDALVATADAHPEAGAVGSRIVSHDGLLLEAGGLLWREGVASHVGRGWPASTPRHRFLRRTDYCSGSSLLVRRTTWDAVGGFDEAYFPGYYEDVDLCLSIGRLGQVVLFEPRSCLRHHESGSLDWDSPYKRFVNGRSQARFMAKWGADLERYPALPQTDNLWARDIVDERALLRASRAQRRLLVVAGDGAAGTRSRAAAVEAVDTLPGWHPVVWAGPATDPDPDGHYADRGVEVLVGDLVAHLGAPTALYDVVLFLDAAAFDALAPAVRALQPQAAVLYDPADTRADVLALDAAAASPAGSPLVAADRLVCRGGFDTALVAMVRGRAPASPSLADAVAEARRDRLRIRGRDRRCGERPH